MTDNQSAAPAGPAPMACPPGCPAAPPPGSPASLLATALQWMATDPAQACRMAAVACAATRTPLDLTTRKSETTPLGETPPGRAAAEFLSWLHPPGQEPAADCTLRILTLAWACAQVPADASPAHVLKAATWLHAWFTSGKPRKPRP